MKENSSKSSYKQTLGAISIFGGVQVFNIIIGIVRSKFIAIILGPEGMGIAGLYTSALNLINSLTGLGLGTSAVRDIASAESANDSKRLSLVVSVFKKLVWITGLIGTVLTILLASILSNWTFGNTDFSFGFVLLSFSLLFLQLTTGQNALLQGLRKYKYLAYSNILGNILGLLATIPLYYFFRFNAIVPVMVLSSFITLVLSIYYTKKIHIESIKLSYHTVFTQGQSMIKLGFFISLQALIAKACAYLVRIYITNHGGTVDVGLYNAGFLLINTYVGLVFTAMATDYYPRLSSNISENFSLNTIVNQQIEIALLMLSPIIVFFIVFNRLIIELLYSSQFFPIQGMMYWSILAIFFKGVSWAIAYVILAKGDTKVYFWNEMSAGLFHLGLNILFYNLWGLTGLGVSFFVGYVTYLIQVWIIGYYKYGFVFDIKIIVFLLFQLLIAVFCSILVLYSDFVKYSIGVLLVITSSIYSFYVLNKKISIVKKLREKIGI